MESLVGIFKALSEPARIRILSLLLNGELCVCNLMAVLDMPQSTASRHLAYLKNSGWITSARRGVWMYYRLAEEEGVRKDILEVLRLYLPQTDGVAADNARLTAFLEQKGHNVCG